MNHGEVRLPEIKEKFQNYSLLELSMEAAHLQETIDLTPDEEPQLEQIIQGYLQDVTADKIDGYAFYHDHLQSEIEVWKQKKAKIAAMCDKVVQSLERRMKALENSLIHLHSINLIDKHLQGHYRAIEIRPSQPKVEVFVPEDELPEPYRVSSFKADKKAILEAYKQGENISDFAEVSQGLHVRFKTPSSAQKRR